MWSKNRKSTQCSRWKIDDPVPTDPIHELDMDFSFFESGLDRGWHSGMGRDFCPGAGILNHGGGFLKYQYDWIWIELSIKRIEFDPISNPIRSTHREHWIAKVSNYFQSFPTKILHRWPKKEKPTITIWRYAWIPLIRRSVCE